MTSPVFDVRRNENGTLDEVLAKAVDIHVEQMDDGAWWMGIYHVDGRVDHLRITSRDGGPVDAEIDENCG